MNFISSKLDVSFNIGAIWWFMAIFFDPGSSCFANRAQIWFECCLSRAILQIKWYVTPVSAIIMIYREKWNLGYVWLNSTFGSCPAQYDMEKKKNGLRKWRKVIRVRSHQHGSTKQSFHPRLSGNAALYNDWISAVSVAACFLFKTLQFPTTFSHV